MNYTKITKCRSCGGKLEDIISLGEQTSVGFTDTPENGIKVPLKLVLCTKCFLLQLKHTTDPSILYNENYGYKSGINDTMKAELKNIVDSMKVNDFDIVVDIGCNDGTLLSNYPKLTRVVGFDPSLGTTLNEGNGLAVACQENLSRDHAEYRIFRDYFNAKSFKGVYGKEKAKVVTAIAMFYDLEDPNKFLKEIYEILDNEGTLIIQQNYLVGMLQNTAFDNVCHEHLEYFSLTSLEPLLRRNGFGVIKVEEREINGGSFRVYAQKHKSYYNEYLSVGKMRSKEKELHLTLPDPYMTFANRVERIAKGLKIMLEDMVSRGNKIYVYGASTRGNSLLQVCGIDNKLISGAAERNPVKYGKYTAGTKIKIVSEEEAREKADFFLVLPWFFKDEFVKREKQFIDEGGTLIFPLPRIELV